MERNLNEFYRFRFSGYESTALASKHSIKSLQCRISEALSTIIFRATIFVAGRDMFVLLKALSAINHKVIPHRTFKNVLFIQVLDGLGEVDMISFPQLQTIVC